MTKRIETKARLFVVGLHEEQREGGGNSQRAKAKPIALDTTVNGHVDANWAKQHHDLWYQQVKDQAVDEQTLKSGGGGSAIGGEKTADV